MSNPEINQVLDQILLQEGIEYAIFTLQGGLIAGSPGLGKLLYFPSSENLAGKPLYEIFPELIGSEDVLQEPSLLPHPEVKLDFVHRTHFEGEIYLTISARQFRFNDIPHLLVSLRDSTHEGSMNQRLMQQRNELHMLAGSLNRMRARLNPLLSKYVPTQVLMESANLLRQEETLVPRLFDIIRNKYQIAYIVITPDLKVAWASPINFPFIQFEPKEIQDHPLAAVFPELIGMEDVLQEILTGKQPILRLENINYNQPGEYPAYLTFSICPLDPIQPQLGLIFVIEDVTSASRQRQQAIQDRNLLRLLHLDLEKARKQAAIALEEAHSELSVRERTEINLRTSQDLLNRALAIARMAVWELDPADRQLTLSDSFFSLLGVTAADAGGYTIPVEQFLVKFIHPDDRRNLLDNITAFFEAPPTELRGEYNLRYFTVTRELHFARVEYQIKPGNGEPGSNSKPLIFGYFMDITQNKQTQAALDQRTRDLEMAVEELEAFSYTVSHDLRAPLRALRGYSQALLDDYSSVLDNDGVFMASMISKAAQRMDRLIEDLLKLSYQDRRAINITQVEPGALVQTALQELKNAYPLERYEISIANLPPCQADPALLTQVFVNLLSNALKYSSKCESPCIQVGWQKQEHLTVYFVRDNGAGFDMAQAGKLFTVFARLHSYSDYEGSGIGLAIVKRIVQRHGGRIWFSSIEKQGSTFYFTLESDSPE